MSVRRQSRGFSLLEAVVALALLGLALPAILSAFADAVSHTARADDRLDTLRRAQDLVTLAIVQFHGKNETRSGSDTNLTWEVNALRADASGSEEQSSSSGIVPVQLTVTVRSRRGAETRLDTLFLFREAPR